MHRLAHDQTLTNRPIVIAVLTLPPIIALDPDMSKGHFERARSRVRTSQTGARNSRSSHGIPIPRRRGFYAYNLAILIVSWSSPLVEHDFVSSQRYDALQSHLFRVKRGVIHDHVPSPEILSGSQLVPKDPVAFAGLVGQGRKGRRHASTIDGGDFEEVVIGADHDGADPEEGREAEPKGVQIDIVAEGHWRGGAMRPVCRGRDSYVDRVHLQ